MTDTYAEDYKCTICGSMFTLEDIVPSTEESSSLCYNCLLALTIQQARLNVDFARDCVSNFCTNSI